MEFDLSKLKKRPSYPFQHIAVAVGFSPRLEAILAEAKRLAFVFNAALLLIHVGSKTQGKEEKLEKMMNKLGLDPKKVRVIWLDEGNEVDSILKLCKLNIVDLLVLGALRKENILKYYIGSLARSVSRKAKCSVLLLANPSVDAGIPKKIFVSGVENPKTKHTINTAIYLASNYHVKEITVVKEVDAPALAMAMAEDSSAPEAKEIRKTINVQEEQKLHSVIEQCDTREVSVKEKIIKGRPGYAINKYARDKKADLLVINSPDIHLNVFDRIFTHDIEYILADLPCNVLIVHSRV